MKVISSNKIYEILEVIRRKPHFYLTSKSITSLQNFLNGYLLMAGFSNDAYNSGDPKIDDFKYWILNKSSTQDGVGNPYSNTLLLECKGDEELAFERFFEYLDEFRKLKND
ncbi:hypothetical protein [Fulvivirga lutimaris]|uniref:hypothetical protein n=1 Tax=Fulvivirga lutimaris TaxID=1819566 RepID=UPI0012BC1D83|nr:hypothetical protein [Fulvivirga lutimaris]MTI41397.1 hypothetical protein [Fulvivirga lutimaris]